MQHVPIGSGTVDGGVLAHWGDRNTIFDRERAERKRREQVTQAITPLIKF